MKICKTLAIASVLVITWQSAQAQRLYKWVDAEGNVYYSDQVPPEHQDYARKELNKQGIVIDEVERAKTEAEKAQERLTRALLREEQRKRDLKRKEDAKLLATYANIDDITRSKEQQIDGIDRSIQASQAFISTQARNLANLLERASQAESQGREVSPALQSLIADVQRQISEQQQLIQDRQNERQKAEEFYSNELVRYQALTGQTPKLKTEES